VDGLGLTTDLAAVAGVIAAGGIAVVPTDTVYGVACDPRDPAALERIYALKERPESLEIGLLAAATDQLIGLVEMEGAAVALADAFWPGPLSLVLPARAGAGLAIPRRGVTLMVRVPAHDRLRELLRLTGPLATTSANRHGRPASTSALEAVQSLGEEVDAVLDGGPASGRASTIIECTVTPPRVLRTGPLDLEELRPYLGV
jgi:tRNA threonylcarbamoyl adenosine modification protein (Sua5/YciO/YrdC/YwlC family)